MSLPLPLPIRSGLGLDHADAATPPPIPDHSPEPLSGGLAPPLTATSPTTAAQSSSVLPFARAVVHVSSPNAPTSLVAPLPFIEREAPFPLFPLCHGHTIPYKPAPRCACPRRTSAKTLAPPTRGACRAPLAEPAPTPFLPAVTARHALHRPLRPHPAPLGLTPTSLTFHLERMRTLLGSRSERALPLPSASRCSCGCCSSTAPPHSPRPVLVLPWRGSGHCSPPSVVRRLAAYRARPHAPPRPQTPAPDARKRDLPREPPLL
nr:proline-rich protein 36-like [Aegilops tauschii subsp. strangulata]